MRDKISALGGIVAVTTVVGFGLYVLKENVPQNNASWIMWTILDALILGATIAAGNKRPWLPAGFTFGALFTTLILLKKGEWHWSEVETLSALGALVATICWWKMGPKSAVVAIVIAMTVAGIPAMSDAWQNPNPASWWLWAGVSLSCILTLFGVKKWTIEHFFLPTGSLCFNSTMTFLVLRGWLGLV